MTLLTGTILSPGGSPVTGALFLQLSQNANLISGGGAVSAIPPYIFNLTAGVISGPGAGPYSVNGADALTPSGLTYHMSVTGPGGELVLERDVSITGTTVDLGTLASVPPLGTLPVPAIFLPVSPLTAPWNAGNEITATAFALPTVTSGVGNTTNYLSQTYTSRGQILAGIIIPTNGLSFGNAFGLAGGNTTLSGAFGQAQENVGVGPTALGNLTTGTGNTAFGWEALFTNTSGLYNTAVGDNALGFNTIGGQNIAVGVQALLTNVVGNSNVAIGFRALQVSVGSFNVAVGDQALALTTTDQGTAIGHQALAANTTGINNVAVGFQALVANTTSANSTGVGVLALGTHSTGDWNTAVGIEALYGNVGGARNTAVGSLALIAALGDGNVALGYNAGKYETGSNAFYVDNQDRTNTAGDKLKALLYGVFGASSSSQVLIANAKFIAQRDAAYTSPDQLLVQGSTNQNQQLVIGYNTASDIGSIQAIKQGTGYEPLLLNGLGGSVRVGQANGQVPCVLFTSTADRTTTANSMTSLIAAAPPSIPANYWSAGRQVRIKFSGFTSQADGGATVRTIQINVAGVGVSTVANLPAGTLAANDFFQGEAVLTCRTTGAAGTVVATGVLGVGVTGANFVFARCGTLTAQALDTTIANTVDVLYNNGNAAGTLTTTSSSVEILNG